MPNKPPKTSIDIFLDSDQIAQVDRAVQAQGRRNRSDFIRHVLTEYFKDHGEA